MRNLWTLALVAAMGLAGCTHQDPLTLGAGTAPDVRRDRTTIKDCTAGDGRGIIVGACKPAGMPWYPVAPKGSVVLTPTRKVFYYQGGMSYPNTIVALYADGTYRWYADDNSPVATPPKGTVLIYIADAPWGYTGTLPTLKPDEWLVLNRSKGIEGYWSVRVPKTKERVVMAIAW